MAVEKTFTLRSTDNLWEPPSKFQAARRSQGAHGRMKGILGAAAGVEVPAKTILQVQRPKCCA